MKSPCRDCKKRYPGCQDKCAEGQAYKKWVTARNAKLRKQMVSRVDRGGPRWREV